MSNETEADFVIDDVDLSDPNLRGWDGSTGPQVPPGEYLVECTKVETKPTKKGDGRNLILTLAVRNEGEFYDTELIQFLKIPGPNDKKGLRMRLKHVIVDCLGVPLLPNGSFQGSAMIGRRMYVMVSVEETVEFDAASNQEIKRTNSRIQQEKPAPNEAAPARAAAASAPPAAAAGRRPAAAPPAGARRP